MTCTDNKRWICDDNIHTLAFGHYKLSEMYSLGVFVDPFFTLGLPGSTRTMPSPALAGTSGHLCAL